VSLKTGDILKGNLSRAFAIPLSAARHGREAKEKEEGERGAGPAERG